MQTQQKLVTVVLPGYNRRDTIRRSIMSVLNQSWQNIELIYIDDCSTDGTVEEVQKIKDRRLVVHVNKKNQGPSAARNIGIRLAKGEWTAFQDSDDEWLHRKLEHQLSLLNKNDKDIVAIYCGMIVSEEIPSKRKGRTVVNYIPKVSINKTEGNITEELLKENFISTQMLLCKTEKLREINGFDENLKALVDWELMIRMSQIGKVRFIDEPLVIQNYSENSITTDRSKRLRSRRQILQKHKTLFEKHPKLLARQFYIAGSEARELNSAQESRDLLREAVKLDPLNIRYRTRSIQQKLEELIHHQAKDSD